MREIALTEAEVERILEGANVEKDGRTFYHTDSTVPEGPGACSSGERWRKLLAGEVEAIDWEQFDLRVVLAEEEEMEVPDAIGAPFINGNIDHFDEFIEAGCNYAECDCGRPIFWAFEGTDAAKYLCDEWSVMSYDPTTNEINP